MKAVVGFIAAVFLSSTAVAQHQHVSGYADLTARPIKALSEEQIENLKHGRGMGLSLPAELNSYPGPAHVLDLEQALSLSADQKASISAIRDDMSQKTKDIGSEILDLEAQLDRVFATRVADRQAVSGLLSELSNRNGQLRAVHILAHMDNTAVLSAEQIATYDILRGYRGAVAVQQHRGHSKH